MNYMRMRLDIETNEIVFIIFDSEVRVSICDFIEFSNNLRDFKALRIKKVIFNDPATIVFWSDGTKTVVKAKNEPYDPEKGLAMAISKKHLGNTGKYYEEFKKWLPNNNEKQNTSYYDELIEGMYQLSLLFRSFNC